MIPLYRELPSLRPPRCPTGRVLVILAPTAADVVSVRALARRLRRQDVEVDAASECHGEVRGEHREELVPNLLLIEAAQRDWDAVVLAGGAGALRVAEDAFAREVVAHAASQHKPIAALGLGRAVLQRAGVAGFATDDPAQVSRWLSEQRH
jgi:putative intracellular protease/amidase